MPDTSNAGTATPEGEGEGATAAAATATATPPPDMRAVVVTSFGGLKSVKVQRRPQPPTPLPPSSLLLKVNACGLNFLDIMTRQGVIESPPKPPFILGYECAGTVEAVGEGVTTFQVGDRVAALSDTQAWAEYVTVPTKHAYKIPVGMNFTDAAAITLSYATAYMLLFDVGGFGPGKSVLVHSAGGAVGHAVAQLANTLDDVTVFGVSSSSKHEAVKTHLTHALDRSSDYVQEVRKVSPEGVDLVLDCICGDESSRGYGVLKPLGRYVLYGTGNIVSGETKSIFSVAKSWWQVDKVSPLKLYDENRSIGGFHFRHLLFHQDGHAAVRSAIERVYKLWQEGKIKPVVDSTWALEDVAEAMQKIHDRKNIGKIVLDLELEPKPKPVQTKGGKESNGKMKAKAESADSNDGEAENNKPESNNSDGGKEDK